MKPNRGMRRALAAVARAKKSKFPSPTPEWQRGAGQGAGLKKTHCDRLGCMPKGLVK